jgi:uncharacterized protein YbbK (DUF523 family)
MACGSCVSACLDRTKRRVSAQAPFSDPSKVIADEKKRDQARRQCDPYGEGLDHPRTLAAIVVKVIKRRPEAEHNEQQPDDDDNANQGNLAEAK